MHALKRLEVQSNLADCMEISAPALGKAASPASSRGSAERPNGHVIRAPCWHHASSAPAPPQHTISISKYAASTDGQARAATLRDKMRNGLVLDETKFVAPGAEAVRQTSARDQIRIYRDADERKRGETAMKPPEFDLVKSLRSLGAGRADRRVS